MKGPSILKRIITTTIVTIGILSVFVFCFLYDPSMANIEKMYRARDDYNFSQVEEIKKVLSQTTNGYNFKDINEFNKLFSVNIKPARNCYYVSATDNGKGYIVGFQFESYKYKQQFPTGYFYYSSIPEYNLDSTTLQDFKNTISLPCKK